MLRMFAYAQTCPELSQRPAAAAFPGRGLVPVFYRVRMLLLPFTKLNLGLFFLVMKTMHIPQGKF